MKFFKTNNLRNWNPLFWNFNSQAIFATCSMHFCSVESESTATNTIVFWYLHILAHQVSTGKVCDIRIQIKQAFIHLFCSINVLLPLGSACLHQQMWIFSSEYIFSNKFFPNHPASKGQCLSSFTCLSPNVSYLQSLEKIFTSQQASE